MAIHSPISDLREPAESFSGLKEGRPENRQDDDFSLLDILVVLADHKRVILWITAVITFLAIPVSLLLPKRYTAMVTVLPPQQNSTLGAMLASQLGGLGGSSSLGNLGGMAALAGSSLGLKNPNDRYIGMLKSRIVEDAVIQRFGLEKEYRKKHLSDARKAFELHTDVDGNAKDGLLHISVEDRDPRHAMEIANGYVDEFRKLSQSLALTEASERRLFFEQQLEKAKDQLANAEEAMKATEESTGLIEITTQTRALVETVASLRAQIAAREMIIQGIESYATNQNAQLVQMQQQLASLKSQLAMLGGSETSDDGLIVPKGLVPKVGLEYVRKLRDVKYYETIFEILARQYELAKIDEAREGAIIQVVDPAIVPDIRSFPKRTYIVIGSFLCGLLISIVTAFALWGYERMKNDPEAALKLDHIRDVLSFKTQVK